VLLLLLEVLFAVVDDVLGVGAGVPARTTAEVAEVRAAVAAAEVRGVLVGLLAFPLIEILLRRLEVGAGLLLELIVILGVTDLAGTLGLLLFVATFVLLALPVAGVLFCSLVVMGWLFLTLLSLDGVGHWRNLSLDAAACTCPGAMVGTIGEPATNCSTLSSSLAKLGEEGECIWPDTAVKLEEVVEARALVPCGAADEELSLLLEPTLFLLLGVLITAPVN
jgi:hypothetical protein